MFSTAQRAAREDSSAIRGSGTGDEGTSSGGSEISSSSMATGSPGEAVDGNPNDAEGAKDGEPRMSDSAMIRYSSVDFRLSLSTRDMERPSMVYDPRLGLEADVGGTPSRGFSTGEVARMRRAMSSSM
jgi:hypothetical protein